MKNFINEHPDMYHGHPIIKEEYLQGGLKKIKVRLTAEEVRERKHKKLFLLTLIVVIAAIVIIQLV